MKITKILDVLTPVISTKKSIGCDFHVPVVNEQFLNTFMMKPNNFHRVDITRNDFTKEFVDEDVVLFFDKNTVEQFYKAKDEYHDALQNGTCPLTASKLVILKIMIECHSALKVFPKRKKNNIEIRRPLTMPTGICFDLPLDVFMLMVPKSSNIYNGYRVIHNTIDEDYVFGVGVQVEPVNKFFNLTSNQKLAQAIFMKKSVDVLFDELPFTDFENLDSVKIKKQYRQGGFGSTGLITMPDN